MVRHSDISADQLIKKIRGNNIKYAGNRLLKIYGHLHCKSGKRMEKENRVFFKNKREARVHGYRPCGNCMRSAYLNWKNGVG